MTNLGIPETNFGISHHPDVDKLDENVRENVMRPLEMGPKLQRALNILDRTVPFQTHKIGLLFAGLSKKEKAGDEVNILNVKHGSVGFIEFTKELGSLVLNRHLKYFSGGLDTSPYASDGEFILIHGINEVKDHRSSSGETMMVFHCVPFMPEGLNNRKRHVGNDYVQLIYVEDSSDCNVCDEAGEGTLISGEFGFVTILIVPIKGMNSFKVNLRIRTGLDCLTNNTLSHLCGSVVTYGGSATAKYVRQLAARADLACRSVQEDRIGLFSNWEERLTQIREMKRYVKS